MSIVVEFHNGYMLQAIMPFFIHRPKNDISLLKNNVFSGKHTQLFLIVFGLILGPAIASAKVRTFTEDALSVTTRQNPDYDPSGIRVGDFNFSPSISNTLKYNDNVYASSIEKVHDLIFTVRPSMNISSDFVRHEMSANFYVEKGLYKDNDGEDYTDYSGELNGRIDITGDTSMPISLAITRDHVRRGSPDERANLRPTVFKLFEGTVGLAHEGQKIAVKTIAGFKRYVFENTIGTLGTVDNGDRDRNLYSLYTSVGLSPDAICAPFVYADILKTEYDRGLDSNGFNRNSFQYEAGVGTTLNFSDVTKATFTVGRLRRHMEDDNLKDTTGLAYAVNVVWEPSTLASFMLEGKRTMDESTLDGISGSIGSSLRLSMNYELFPNLFFNPYVGFIERIYEGLNDPKTHTWDAGIAATYKMNRNVWLGASYQYINQDEKEPSPDLDSYENNVFGVSMNLQF